PRAAIERCAGRRDRRVDVRRPALGDLGDRLAGRRVLGREPTPIARRAEVAVDEEIGPETEPRELDRVLLAVGDERVGHIGGPSGAGSVSADGGGPWYGRVRTAGTGSQPNRNVVASVTRDCGS